MNKITDVSSRSAKTFFQTFLATLIVEAVIVAVLFFKKLHEFNFADVFTWLIFIAFAVAIGVIASAISAIQNAAHNRKVKRHAEWKGGKK